MALTWEQLDSLELTWDEFDRLGIETWQELDALTYEKLLSLAKEKLDRFKSLSDDVAVDNEISKRMDQIYKEASSTIPSFKLAPPTRWTKPLSEIMFGIIFSELVKESMKQLPRLLALIISTIDRLTNL